MSFIPQDKNRSSPLIPACGENHPQVACLLIENGADVKYQDNVRKLSSWSISFDTKFYFPLKYGKTALHWASQNGHPKIVKILVQAQAHLNVKDKVSTKS